MTAHSKLVNGVLMNFHIVTKYSTVVAELG